MADLGGGRAMAGSGNVRAQNGGSRIAAGPVPVPQAPAARAMTPTEVMRRRAARIAREQAETETRQRAQEEEEQARVNEQRRLSEERRAAAAGVATGGISRTEPGAKRSSGVRRSGGEQITQDSAERRRSDKVAGSSTTRVTQTTNAQLAVPVPASTRAPESASGTRVPADAGRIRATSQPQPRPVQPQTSQATSATFTPQQQASQSRLTSAGNGTTQAQAGPSAGPSFQRPQAQQSTGTQPRNTNASSFPHAFERWETLSSHWEGLTSYWIRRLESNSGDMEGQPINQQLARQVTDLSAAGANLFHAVVELQRLRASSERKFQRWFYETRSDLEKGQERIAVLENALRAEQQARSEAALGGARADVESVIAERAVAEEIKRKADQMVKEMRRELQISRDEARRGWEEIGRMEQAERDRTTSLRNGEPTLVGGVQVVPMLQGGSSRQDSANRPSTRDGPLPGDIGSIGGTTLSNLRAAQESLESPGDVGYTNYDPARSETDTDPFTEGGHDTTTQGVPRAPAVPSSAAQPSTSNSATAAIQAARSAATTSHPISPQRSAPGPISAPSQGTGGTYLSYGPSGGTLQTPTSSSFYQHQGSGTALLRTDLGQQQPRGPEADQQSYVPSVDTLSEEDYELDAQGNVRRDAAGRPQLSRQRSGSEDSDEYNVDEQLARERAYGIRYGSNVSGVEYGTGSTALADAQIRPGAGGSSNGAGQGPVDYSGSGYGWESVPRHHHPTRLSDVLEEDERSRTSPSRASERSRGLH